MPIAPRRPATAAIHTRRAESAARPISSPIFQTSTFASASSEDFARVAVEVATPDFYTRHGNPNHVELAEAVATLEGAETGLVFASGLGALTTTVLALASGGDHVVAQRSMYGGALSLVQNLLPRFGVTCTLVDQADTSAWEDAITPATRLFLIESPSNPRLEITDLRAVADIARRREITTLADNTFATPINQRPLDHGIDLVWHSATKYLAGHSDASAGVVVGREDLIAKIWSTSINVGAVLGPFDAWLVMRGVRTLDLRVGRHNATADSVAEHLHTHPAVSAVHYPGLPDHASHHVAAAQMSGFGGVLSIELRGGIDAAVQTIERLELFHLSASLGSVESLAVHPPSMWKAVLSDEEVAEAGIQPGLVRLACGQEDVRDLIDDLDQALQGA
ncbi:MAG: Cys/Met metabolism pyridoxal-phosphate-dependent protein [Solirubrobacterales bacterium]|nr:Cys/Met metabolism pyridoxal-phosphate-dependent protein [Solirubrobacterales bacterium]